MLIVVNVGIRQVLVSANKLKLKLALDILSIEYLYRISFRIAEVGRSDLMSDHLILDPRIRRRGSSSRIGVVLIGGNRDFLTYSFSLSSVKGREKSGPHTRGPLGAVIKHYLIITRGNSRNVIRLFVLGHGIGKLNSRPLGVCIRSIRRAPRIQVNVAPVLSIREQQSRFAGQEILSGSHSVYGGAQLFNIPLTVSVSLAYRVAYNIFAESDIISTSA